MSRKRILLVEDEPLISLDIEMTLDQLGHEVLAAPTVAEALERMAAGDVDLAILDYHLKEADTTEVAARLRQAGVPFIVCSGSVGLGEVDRAFAGASFLAKPFSTDVLLKAVEDAADGLPASGEGIPA